MKTTKTLVLFCFVLTSISLFAQNKKAEEVLEEGKLLFRLEKGSWYGTDHLVENYSSKTDSLGGYLSYETEENTINTIFFNRYNPDEILVRYMFGETPGKEPKRVDLANRKATDLEKDLIALRLDATNQVNTDVDGFFSHYENTSLNFIPVIKGKERHVFILTGPQVSGVVLLGNDYKLTYNSKNKMKSKMKIHNSLLQFSSSGTEDIEDVSNVIHSHVVTDLISSTDICTLLLYRDYVEWKLHIVVGKKNVSLFDMENAELVTIKLKHWMKMAESIQSEGE